MSITYSECVSVTLVIQHLKVMQRIILSFVTCLNCYILTNLELCKEIFKNYFNIKFHEILPSASLGVPCGRTDRHRQAWRCRQQLFATLRIPLIITADSCRWHGYLRDLVFPVRNETIFPDSQFILYSKLLHSLHDWLQNCYFRIC
jgi:hypothetical protein